MFLYQNRIEIVDGKRSGKPCVKGTRLTVSDVLSFFASGMTVADVLSDFPALTEEDIRACFAYASDREKRFFYNHSQQAPSS